MSEQARRFRNEPDRTGVDESQEWSPPERDDQARLPETNSGRAALAASVRGWRAAQAPLARAFAGASSQLDSRSRGAASAAGYGDLSSVRVHTDPAAAQAAGALSARAFTVGDDVFFGAGQYAPGTEAGDELLGHELAHAAQQRGADAQVATKLEVSTPGDAMEVEADRAGSTFARAARGEAVERAPISRAEPTIARDIGFHYTYMPPERMVDLDQDHVRTAVAFNRGRRLPAAAWEQIARVVSAPSSEIGAELVQAVARFQHARGFAADGRVTDVTLQRIAQTPGGAGLEQHVASNDAVYLGLNPSSREHELDALRRSAGANHVTAITGAPDLQDDTAMAGGRRVNLNGENGLDAFLAEFSALSAGRRELLRSFLGGGQDLARDELAQLATVLYQAETGQRLIKRMVLSGHSGGTEFWGDENGGIAFSHLTQLKDVFPMAMGQVEDLMLSACNTAWSARLPQYLAIFPNLRTIWGYVGYSPSAGTGSTRHVGAWERGTRGAASHQAMSGARQQVAAGPGQRDQNVAIWTRDRGAANGSYETESPYALSDRDTMRATVDSSLHHYEAAMSQGIIDQDALNQLYTNLQALVGVHGYELGSQRDRYTLILQQTLRLRHWSNITRHFMTEHGETVRGAYAAAHATAPVYAGASRAQVLRHIADFPGDRSGAAFELLTSILRDVDPARLPDSWN